MQKNTYFINCWLKKKKKKKKKKRGYDDIDV